MNKIVFFKTEVGRYKTWIVRLQSYLGPLNFIMVLYLYIIQEPLGIIWQVWVVILVVLLAFVLAFDMRVIYPSEARFISRKNPEWVEMREEILEILRIVRGKKEK